VDGTLRQGNVEKIPDKLDGTPVRHKLVIDQIHNRSGDVFSVLNVAGHMGRKLASADFAALRTGNPMALVLGAFKPRQRRIENLSGFHYRLNTGQIVAAGIAAFRTILLNVIGVIAVLKSTSGMPLLPAGFSAGTLSQGSRCRRLAQTIAGRRLVAVVAIFVETSRKLINLALQSCIARLGSAYALFKSGIASRQLLEYSPHDIRTGSVKGKKLVER
jgi:hypothetical protein